MAKGHISAAIIHTAGDGYVLNELVSIKGGTAGMVKVTGLLGQAPTTLQITNPGQGYISSSDVATVATVGQGLTLDIIVGVSVGWGPVPGQGTIQEHNRWGNIVRMRTIQAKAQAPQKLLGTTARAHPSATIWTYVKHKVAALADFWATQLTAGERTDWDNLASGPGNGFDKFMRWNTLGYREDTILTNIRGQNYGDVDSPLLWEYEPCMPIAPTSIVDPDDNGLTIAFVGQDKLHFTNITVEPNPSTQDRLIVLYSTRPWDTFWNQTANPLLRLAVYVFHHPDNAWLPSWPSPAPLNPDKALWERTIGGAVTGQKITAGYRYIAIGPTSIPGPLHFATYNVF